MKQIIITIDPKGKTELETKGFVGRSCQAGSKAYEEALGSRTKETLKSEFYQSDTVSQQTQQRS